MMKTAAVFINRHSGRVLSSDLHELHEALDGPLCAAGLKTSFFIDDCPSLLQAVEDHHPPADYYITIGGDGTIAALADAVTRFEDHKPVFVPLPFGTANMFTRDLGLPLDPWEALEAAIKAPVAAVDVARVNGRAFLNNVVIGVFAEIAEAREHLRDADNLHDITLSLFETADALFYTPEHHYRVLMDNAAENISTNTIIVSNNAFQGAEGGIPHRTRIDSGELAVYLTETRGGLDFMARIAEAVTGNLDTSDAVRPHACQTCVISPRDGEPVHYTVDGEIIVSEEPLLFTIDKQALRVPVLRPADED